MSIDADQSIAFQGCSQALDLGNVRGLHREILQLDTACLFERGNAESQPHAAFGELDGHRMDIHESDDDILGRIFGQFERR